MYPINGECYITQRYGLTDYARSTSGQVAYKNFPGGIHPGFDFGTHGKHLEAISLVRGKVVRAAFERGWGNHVEILGDDGWRRQYAHLHRISVKIGQEVSPGDVIGLVGTTGSSTGIHLHYGNRRAKTFGWDYRNPSADFVDLEIPEPPTIKAKLIKANDSERPQIYAYANKKKFYIPDVETLKFFFGDERYDLIEPDYFDKIPVGSPLPSIK